MSFSIEYYVDEQGNRVKVIKVRPAKVEPIDEKGNLIVNNE